MVTNKDECVTAKSPAKNILVENIHSDSSGGCAFGGLGAGTAHFKDHLQKHLHVVTEPNDDDKVQRRQRIPRGCGAGELHRSRDAYSLDIDRYWPSMKPVAGSGVQLHNITVKNWRAPGRMAPSAVPSGLYVLTTPCTDITISDFAMWTETGSKQLLPCRFAYGKGTACLKPGSGKAYASTIVTQTMTPSGYSARTIASDLKMAFGITEGMPNESTNELLPKSQAYQLCSRFVLAVYISTCILLRGETSPI